MTVGTFCGLPCRFSEELSPPHEGWLAVDLVLVPETGPNIKLARATYFDALGHISLTLFEDDLPVELVLALITETARRSDATDPVQAKFAPS